MSRRSDQGIVGGIAGVVGLAAAAGVAIYTGYQWLKEMQTTEDRTSTSAIPMPPKPAEPEKMCFMCQKNIPASDLVTLDCSHLYHRICLHANYILHMADANYKCPLVNCQCIVNNDRLASLF